MVLSFKIEGFLGIFRTLTGVGVRSKANMLHIKLSRGGEPMTTNGDFGELRQRFDLESP